MKRRKRILTTFCFLGCFTISVISLVGLDEVDAEPQESRKSIKSISKKSEYLSAKGTPKVFQIDKKAILLQQKRLELTHLTRLLRDPTSLAARIALEDPNKDADKVIKDLMSRRKELIKELINDSKKLLTSEEALVTQRWFQWPPPGDEFILGLESLSMRDALEDMRISSADAARERRLEQLKERPCNIRQGRITEPGSLRVFKDLMGDGTAEGNIAYRLDDGVLPFRAYLEDTHGSTDTYIMMSELSFTFPAPLCDSTLTWEFKLGAGAGLSCGADMCMVYLDYYFAEQPNVAQNPEHIKIRTAGALLKINESISWDGIKPITVSGCFDVAAHTESRVGVLIIVSLWARDGLAMTDGIFQLYAGEWGGFSPGVRYRFDPKQ